MDKFTRLTAKACPLMQANLNTDQILPARYLKWPRSRGLGAVLFQDLRLDKRAVSERTSRSISRLGAMPKSFLPGAISAAVPRARPPSMPFATTAFVALLRRLSATFLRRTR